MTDSGGAWVAGENACPSAAEVGGRGSAKPPELTEERFPVSEPRQWRKFPKPRTETKMEPIILFGSELAFRYELQVAREYFEVIEQRCACPRGTLVVGRYSILPFYLELQREREDGF